LAKRELFEKTHHRLVNTLFGGFSVNREKPQGSTFRTALQILRAGGVVTLFPEGGIVDTLGQKGFKAGVGTLATMSGASILPIYITGSDTLIDMQRALSDTSFLAIRVGELLRPVPGRGREAREHAARLAEESLRNLEREYLASYSKISVKKSR
jgi:1-acyl-sn-glycerol-3-phosphate acyltransferase